MKNQIKATLIERIRRSQDVESFRFKAKERIDFIPGQFTQLIFDFDNPGNRELNKYLSFSSSPAKQYFELTKRLTKSAFSQRLANLENGSELVFKLPSGNCLFKDEDKRIAFLAGGIGIAPVISIIEYIVDEKLDTDLVVLYSNKTEDIAFRSQLDNWQKAYSNIKVFYTITDCEPKDRQCMAGVINEDLVKQRINGWCGRIFFIFGPPAMVGAMYRVCIRVGCKQSTINRESFIGY